LGARESEGLSKKETFLYKKCAGMTTQRVKKKGSEDLDAAEKKLAPLTIALFQP